MVEADESTSPPACTIATAEDDDDDDDDDVRLPPSLFPSLSPPLISPPSPSTDANLWWVSMKRWVSRIEFVNMIGCVDRVYWHIERLKEIVY